MAMTFDTAELCDRFANLDNFQVAEPMLRHYGGKQRFCGAITTLKVFEDNSLVRSTLEEKVSDRVLIIDGGGSKRCALLGDTLSQLAVDNGWQGILVYGCVRGSDILAKMPIGVMALNTHPLCSRKHGQGHRDSMITFAGINFKQDHYLYADSDGIIVAESKLD
jgi:regulator of ribonuclease activity A